MSRNNQLAQTSWRWCFHENLLSVKLLYTHIAYTNQCWRLECRLVENWIDQLSQCWTLFNIKPLSSSLCSSRASVPVVRGAAFGGWPAQLGPLGLAAPTASDAAPVGAPAGPGSATAAGVCPKRHPGWWPSQCYTKHKFSHCKPQPQHQPQHQPQS